MKDIQEKILRRYIVLLFLTCLACSQQVQHQEEVGATSFQNAEHILQTIKANEGIIDIECSQDTLIINYLKQGIIIYHIPDLPFVAQENTCHVEDYAGKLNYDSGELLLIVYDKKALYLFLNDGRVISASVGMQRPNIISVFDAYHYLSKPNLKVLDIGNSYTDDATAYVKDIVLSQGDDLHDMCLYMLLRGSASYRSWINKFNRTDNDVCFMLRVAGELPIACREGYEEHPEDTLFLDVLTNEQWDLIIIHQVSNYSTDYSLWNETGPAGGLDEFLTILHNYQPNAAVGFLMVHSYSDNFEGNIEKSSKLRWQNIAKASEDFCNDYGIGFVIPYGTAVENIRTCLPNENDYSRDGVHLGHGLGRYVASCCYYETLLAPRTNHNIIGNQFRYKCPPDISQCKHPGGCIDVTDDNALHAQQAATEAIKDKYAITSEF